MFYIIDCVKIFLGIIKIEDLIDIMQYFGDFVSLLCLIDPNVYIERSKFFNAYQDYVIKLLGSSKVKLSPKNFSPVVRAIYPIVRIGRNNADYNEGNYYKGITLIDKDSYDITVPKVH